ncbi:MAG TPA: hypothetical protein VMF08_10145 [Candidatus Sulfotelmatobacter sp.]|nr:hypothetical protein [Candidatus Sulfotelmatobacter sp.]
MKTINRILPVFVVLLTSLAARANVLFSDALNYPNGCIETDGLWFAYSPSTPETNALISNDLLQLVTGSGEDSVAAPGGPSYPTGFTNSVGTFTIASFTINVSQLPAANNYFAELMQITNNTDVSDVAHVFIDTEGTLIPGTYRLGLANAATSFSTAGTTNYPMDLATGITYTVVFSYDPNQNDPLPSGTLWINPSSINDFNVYATDTATNNPNISAIAFSPYANAQIGYVSVGTQFSDVDPGVQTNAPEIGVQPQSASIYASNAVALYTTASAIDVTYQWYSNGTALVDGPNVVGSLSNILVLSNLDATASYSAVASSGGYSSTTSVATITVNTTPTAPFFTLEPTNVTESDLSPVTLAAAANGTGPITYQWYFEPAGSGSFSALSGATTPTYNFTGGYNNSGSYYVVATGGAGSIQSTTITLNIIPPTLVPISYMHQFISSANGTVSLNGGEIFNVEGVVTCIGQTQSKTSSEFYIQDGTGGCFVYAGGFSPTNTPTVGTLVNVISPAQSYYGQVEMDPTTDSSTNAIFIVSTNNPLPAPLPLNIGQMGTNTLGTYGRQYECSLMTMTNVYLYSNSSGETLSGNFPTNGTKALYAFQQPYQAGAPYVEIYVYTYTNPANQLNTNYWGKPLPHYAYEVTGVNGVYSPTEPNFYPSRYQDFVTTLPAPFSASVAVSNGVPTVSWPAVVGSTYSVYSASNLLGPWTQTFGQAYYPSIGSFTDTNATTAKYYFISSP